VGELFHFYAIAASFLGTGVELVEALTIILAVSAIRGWRSALTGALAAAVLLSILVVAIGLPLAHIIQVLWVQLLVGLLMLFFGIRWLRKSILRYAGLKPIHNESESYAKEIERQKGENIHAKRIDKFAFVTAFSGTFIEGLESIFIVITFGISSGAMRSSIFGAIIALLAVSAAGVFLHKPLAKVPENTMKYIVGLLLTSFGAFWIGEGLQVSWLQNDWSILYIAGSLCLFSWIEVQRCHKLLGRVSK